jgi:hypothetical protein
LICTHPADVAGERVQRVGQKLLDAECPQDSQQVLDADAAIARLDAPNYSSRYVGALSQLSLREAAQLPPRGDALCQPALGTADRRWNCSVLNFVVHI